ncbi:hypothetical protein AB0L80_03525 [Streptomyces sp. NPDC052069]|uniref:hypothetical protein n=1 Tax=Streptomyces sp. NPDC052069 TaxID=3154650 RepID=UPI00343FD30C
MTDFRRPPEWEQAADRHTRLADPVLTVRQLSRFGFARKSLTRIDHALVFSTPDGSYDTFLPPVRPTRAEAAGKRYTAVYEVDMGVHPVHAELVLPSDNDAFEFGLSVELSWQVHDPALFVASGYRDVPRLLLGELEQAARPVTRRFPVDRSADAEQEMLRAVHAWGPLGTGAGLGTTWTARLRRDRENIGHQRRIQAIDHAATEQIHAERRGMEYDAELDRRTRTQDALQAGRAMEYGERHQELALQQQRWQHERALLAAADEVELQRAEAEKIDFYRTQLEQGGVRAWALHLSRHPEDSRTVLNGMREDQLRMIQAQMDLVRQLLGGDGAESYELEGPKKLALQAVHDILTQRLPGVSQDWSGPRLGPPAQETAPPQDTPPYETRPYRSPPYETHTHGPQPYEARPYEPQPHEPQPHESQLYEPQPHESQLYEPQPHEPQPHEARPHESRPHASQPHESQPYETYPYGSRPHPAPPPPQDAPAHGAPQARVPAQDTAPATFSGWQPPPGYGSAPVMPAPAVPPRPTEPPAAPPQPSTDGDAHGVERVKEADG